MYNIPQLIAYFKDLSTIVTFNESCNGWVEFELIDAFLRLESEYA